MALLLHRRGITRVRPLLGGLGGWMEKSYPLQPHRPSALVPEGPAQAISGEG